jgi:hypothetical protein
MQPIAHCVYGEGVPKWHKLKKQEYIDYLTTNGVPFDPTMSAIETKQLVMQYIVTKNVKLEVE